MNVDHILQELNGHGVACILIGGMTLLRRIGKARLDRG